MTQEVTLYLKMLTHLTRVLVISFISVVLDLPDEWPGALGLVNFD